MAVQRRKRPVYEFRPLLCTPHGANQIERGLATLVDLGGFQRIKVFKWRGSSVRLVPQRFPLLALAILTCNQLQPPIMPNKRNCYSIPSPCFRVSSFVFAVNG